MNILITGAAGYLGRQVVAALAKDPRTAHVIALDIGTVTEAEQLAGVTYAAADIRAPEVAALLQEHAVEVVIHLACVVTPPAGMSRAEQRSIDVDGTRNVVDACLKHGVRKLVVTSSGAAYGYHADNAPLLTEDHPVRGHDAFAYSAHKREVEELLAAVRGSHPQLAQLILRPGTILGASTHNQITALWEQPVVVGLSDAASPFTFVWDQDMVAIVVEGTFGSQAGVFNVSADGVMTLREIAATLGKRYVGLPSKAVGFGLKWLSRWQLTPYGEEQVCFLAHRPVLSNARLKGAFAHRPRKTTREVFALWAQ